MNEYKIDNVERLKQGDNAVEALKTCYPTSLAMAVNYCLGLKGKNKTDIGVDKDEQIEDHITRMTMLPETKAWATRSLEPWVQNYINKLWLVAAVEVKIFNDLMKNMGYESRFIGSISFDEICNTIETARLPQVVYGYFAPVHPSIKGHINCLVGFKRKERKLVVHDPYANANEGFRKPDGAYLEYSYDRFFVKNPANKKAWLHNIYSI